MSNKGRKFGTKVLPIRHDNYFYFPYDLMSAYHLYGNFGENFPSNGTGIFFWRPKQGRDSELYYLQNTSKFFTFSRHEAWHW